MRKNKTVIAVKILVMHVVVRRGINDAGKFIAGKTPRVNLIPKMPQYINQCDQNDGHKNGINM